MAYKVNNCLKLEQVFDRQRLQYASHKMFSLTSRCMLSFVT